MTSASVHATAAAVREGRIDARLLVETTQARIRDVDESVLAFQSINTEAAREAHLIQSRPDLDRLPLAGVPIAMKDVTGTVPEREHAMVLRRIRDSGAVIIGATRSSELGLWPTTDSADGGVTRSALAAGSSASGSSGGSAAAVAAGFVPAAHGTDAMGSVRAPAAAAGIVGMVATREGGGGSWNGLLRHGAFARCVADASALLAVLTDRPGIAGSHRPPRSRIAVSTCLPATGRPVPALLAVATMIAAGRLAKSGHGVSNATPSYGGALSALSAVHWVTGPRRPDDEEAVRALPPRSRKHLAIGNALRFLHGWRAGRDEAWRRRALAFFRHHDVLLTPALASDLPRADRWRERGWLANTTTVAHGAFLVPWSIAGFPAVSLALGGPTGAPRHSVQLVGAPGDEDRLFGIAAELERITHMPSRIGARLEESWTHQP